MQKYPLMLIDKIRRFLCLIFQVNENLFEKRTVAKNATTRFYWEFPETDH